MKLGLRDIVDAGEIAWAACTAVEIFCLIGILLVLDQCF